LLERGINHCHIMNDMIFPNVEKYKEFLGKSLLYFNPTFQSPMPRSRTEAMFSGCCIITTGNQDEETFIDGKMEIDPVMDIKDVKDYRKLVVAKADELIAKKVNGFLVKKNPWLVTDLIEHLLMNRYREACEIGERGRKLALKLFNFERYQNDWRCLFEKVLNKKIEI